MSLLLTRLAYIALALVVCKSKLVDTMYGNERRCVLCKVGDSQPKPPWTAEELQAERRNIFSSCYESPHFPIVLEFSYTRPIYALRNIHLTYHHHHRSQGSVELLNRDRFKVLQDTWCSMRWSIESGILTRFSHKTHYHFMMEERVCCYFNSFILPPLLCVFINWFFFISHTIR